MTKLSKSQIKILRVIEIKHILNNTAYISRDAKGWVKNESYTIDTLVSNTGLSEGRVRYSLNRLEALGFITKRNDRYSRWKLHKTNTNKIIKELNRLGISMIHNKNEYYTQSIKMKKEIDEMNIKINKYRTKKNYNVTTLNNMIGKTNDNVSKMMRLYFKEIKKLKIQNI